MDLTGQERSYLRQLDRFNRLKWFIDADEHKSGDCFGEMADANECLKKKKDDTVIAKQKTGVIILDREAYLRILEKAQDKRMINKQSFFSQIPLFQQLR